MAHGLVVTACEINVSYSFLRGLGMKHAILGAGAVGGLAGTALASLGKDVTVVVRPEKLASWPPPGACHRMSNVLCLMRAKATAARAVIAAFVRHLALERGRSPQPSIVLHPRHGRPHPLGDRYDGRE